MLLEIKFLTNILLISARLEAVNCLIKAAENVNVTV
jgi:hypothetical protein